MHMHTDIQHCILKKRISIECPNSNWSQLDPQIQIDHNCQSSSTFQLSIEKPNPVVMTTALEDGRNLFDAHAQGCVEYLVKPLMPRKVADILKKLKRDLGEQDT